MAWLSGYTYRKKKPVNSTTAGAQTNYQMKLLVGESSGASGEEIDCEGHCLDFPNDIRFTAANGTTKHDYWVESISGESPNRLATIQIEVASIPASGDVDFYMYYGKSGDSGESNGDNTFEFFDDFGDGAYGESGIISDFGNWLRNRASYTIGDYAYVVEKLGLHIIDISNINSPVLKGYIALGTDQCIDIVGDASYAYVSNYNSNKLYVVNVSNVNSPSIAGSVTDATKLKAIHGIFKLGDFIYCCGYSAGTDGHFTIVDVSTPGTPTIRGTIANDANNYIKGSHDVAVIGNYAYMTGSNHNVNTDGRFTILNISDKDSISVVSSITNSSLHRIADVQISGNYAFVGQFGYGTPIANRYFRVIDISNVNSPSVVGGLAGHNMYKGSIYGNLIYCADNRYDTVTVLDISTPTAPTLVKRYWIPGSTAVLDVFLTANGNHAIVARYHVSTNSKFHIIDTSITPGWIINNSKSGDTVSAATYKLVMTKGGISGYLQLIKETGILYDYKRFWDFLVTYPSGKRCDLVLGGNNANPAQGAIHIIFDSSGVRYYDTGYHTICAMSADTEYKISIVPDVSADTFDIYVFLDGTEVSYSGAHTGLSFRNNATYLNQWRPTLYTANTNEGTYDNFLICNYASPEPTWGTSGSEESAPPEEGQPTMARWHGIPGMNYTGRGGANW